MPNMSTKTGLLISLSVLATAGLLLPTAAAVTEGTPAAGTIVDCPFKGGREEYACYYDALGCLATKDPYYTSPDEYAACSRTR